MERAIDKNMKVYSGWRYDILKMFLAVLVVLLHVETLPQGLAALLTVAVPTFFMISSFLFWMKVDNRNDMIPDSYIHFAKRILTLYLFWIVLLLIPTVFINRYFIGVGFWEQVVLIVRDFFMGSIFPASWYLMGLVLGMLIITSLVYYFHASNIFLLCFTAIFYIVCWIECGEFSSFNVDEKFHVIHDIIPCMSSSFVSSLFWCSLGKFCYDYRERICHISSSIYFIMLLISLAFLFLEDYYGPSRYCLAVIPSSFFLFSAVMNYKEKDQRDLRFLRRISIIVYVTHKTIIILVNTVMRFMSYDEITGFPLFLIALSLSVLSAILLLEVSKKTQISWLRYAY